MVGEQKIRIAAQKIRIAAQKIRIAAHGSIGICFCSRRKFPEPEVKHGQCMKMPKYKRMQ